MSIQDKIETAQVHRRITPTYEWTITRPLNDWLPDDEAQAEFLFIVNDGFARMAGMTRQLYINEPAEFHTRNEAADMIGENHIRALEEQASDEWGVAW